VDENANVTVQGYNINGTALGTVSQSGKISYDPFDPTVLTISWGGIPAENIEGVPSTGPIPSYGISLNPSANQDFGVVTSGYPVPTARDITISNTGNQPIDRLTIALGGINRSAFTISKTTIAGLTVGSSDHFTVVPVADLAVGTYTATVTVSGAGLSARSFNVRFAVEADSSANDDTDINAAQILVEGTSYTAAQADVADAVQAKAAVEAIIDRLNLNGVTATVTADRFTAAAAGTVADPAGSDGRYTFTITLSKGGGTPVTTPAMELIITATSYREQTFPLSIRAEAVDGGLTYGTWMQTNLTTPLAPCTWSGNSSSALPRLYSGTVNIETAGKYYFVLAGTARWSLDGTCKVIEVEVDDHANVVVQGYDISAMSLGAANPGGRISYSPADPGVLVVSWGGCPEGNIEGVPAS
jgi:hypothetical protein